MTSGQITKPTSVIKNTVQSKSMPDASEQMPKINDITSTENPKQNHCHDSSFTKSLIEEMTQRELKTQKKCRKVGIP